MKTLRQSKKKKNHQNDFTKDIIPDILLVGKRQNTKSSKAIDIDRIEYYNRKVDIIQLEKKFFREKRFASSFNVTGIHHELKKRLIKSKKQPIRSRPKSLFLNIGYSSETPMRKTLPEKVLKTVMCNPNKTLQDLIESTSSKGRQFFTQSKEKPINLRYKPRGVDYLNDLFDDNYLINNQRELDRLNTINSEKRKQSFSVEFNSTRASPFLTTSFNLYKSIYSQFVAISYISSVLSL